MSGSHLTEAAYDALQGTPGDRIKFLQKKRWMGYPRATHVLNLLEDLVTEERRDRMPNLIVYGDTNNGKTHIIRQFQRLHPASDQPEQNKVHIPALYFVAPPIPNESRFWDKVLMSVFATFRPGDSPGKKATQALLILKQLDLGVIVIDEIHDMLSGPTAKYQPLLNIIKQLGSELQVPIVAVGTQAARRTINNDPQLANRFDSVDLPIWKFDNTYLQLLADMERVIPLPDPSFLYEERLARHILEKTEGLVGEMFKFVNGAAKVAIRMEKRRITRTVLDATPYVKPSNRRADKVIEV